MAPHARSSRAASGQADGARWQSKPQGWPMCAGRAPHPSRAARQEWMRGCCSAVVTNVHGIGVSTLVGWFVYSGTDTQSCAPGPARIQCMLGYIGAASMLGLPLSGAEQGWATVCARMQPGAQQPATTMAFGSEG